MWPRPVKITWKQGLNLTHKGDSFVGAFDGLSMYSGPTNNYAVNFGNKINTKRN